jgi:hypothetical protein
MSKLQLYITKSFNGYESLLNLNPAPDVRQNVSDIRRVLESVKYDSSEKNIFYLLSSTNEGIFITVIRTIPPERLNHLAAWIYIPGDMIIDAQQLDMVVRTMTRIVSGHGVNGEGVVKLRELFSLEYPVDANRPAITASAHGEYAWRVYGGQYGPDLKIFMGAGRYQQSFLPYQGVLLVDADLDIEVSLPDLSDIVIGEEATIMPPEKTDEGFSARVFGRPLDKPLLGTKGGELVVEWTRPGFESVYKTEIVDSDEFTPSIVSTVDSRKIIKPSSFNITSQTTHDPISDCSIRVNGIEIDTEGHSFTQNELTNASVVITRDGFFTYTTHLDLASTTRALIQLQERRKIYRFELPLKTSDMGAPVKFEVLSKRPLVESPIEGYVLLDDIQEGQTRTNHLGYKGVGVGTILHRVAYMVIGLIIGVLLMLCTSKCGSSEKLAPAATGDSVAADTAKVDTVEGKKNMVQSITEVAAHAQNADSAQAEAQAADPNLTDKDAIKYLDDNKSWNRDEMEKFAALRGLFDDMNTLKLQRLIDVWGPKLKNSKNFSDIVYHAEQSIRKKRKLDRDSYNNADDNVISYVGYKNYIDK